MNWSVLTTEEQLNDLVVKSTYRPQLIFKHSTRCSISQVVKTRLERSEVPAHIDFHYLDLLSNRSLSNKISEDMNVDHESPQVLLIQNGSCVFNESHLVIRMEDLLEKLIV